MNYLLVTLIPFRRTSDGAAIVDSLWATDLHGLRQAIGEVTIAAPETLQKDATKGWWGTGETPIHESEGIRFAGLPSFHNPVEAARGALKLRSLLHREVMKADIVHSSNYFSPYLGLAYAHRLAVRKGKKTVFVVAEDFYDFLEWTYAQKSLSGLRKWRALRALAKQESLTRHCLSSATVSFLHTPAAMHRYRLCAPRGIAIRQPVHEATDVVSEASLAERAARASKREPLRLVVAARLVPLKGVDFLLRAVLLLKTQQIPVCVEIYGDGPEKTALEGLAKTLGIQAQILFHGGVAPGPDFRRALEGCDLAIMAHLTNDFGRAFWDAMAAGLPVIAFHSDAATHTVRDRLDGLLAPMADVEGLADRILQAHHDRELLRAMSAAARQRALLNTRSAWNGLRLARIKELVQIPERSALKLTPPPLSASPPVTCL